MDNVNIDSHNLHILDMDSLDIPVTVSKVEITDSMDHSTLVMKMSTVVTLDTEGEATLEVGDFENGNTTKFLISTKVLSLASPVFAKMFGPYFAEGAKIRSGELLNVKLEDDDAFAMEIILNVLHHRQTDDFQLVTSEMLANISILCDKYSCVSALSWLSSYGFTSLLTGPRSTLETGLLLLAAYTLNDAKQFKAVSMKYIEDLKPNFILTWREDSLLKLLPDEVTTAVSEMVQKLLHKFHSEIEGVETKLRWDKTNYITEDRCCLGCGRIMPGEAKRCHPCANSTFYQKMCTSESRIAAYFEFLATCGLWPTTNLFQTCSLTDLVVCLEYQVPTKQYRNEDRFWHYCTGGKHCPLLIQIEGLKI